ncbi:Ger(x)C family spore germination C-terminal domain-containing protein [Paenibacillus sp. N1-5-1-14]|uniref:Ger(x)C family spore germination C-terminal domain-containing protein n=1 Tax=Paenibacillus radicibacter TaxID=2972488 RepID=UPI002158ACBE|nr:Ger(x)C family spore germination C-terminal domain-containing protein [Paenibacillus radicibacter]MCR8644692.1 Ger(x)C family spore germination C-terminal domain-containing protein [Paenibacillus radicibacter]
MHKIPQFAKGTDIIRRNRIAFQADAVDLKTKTKYENGHFVFDLKIKMHIEITEKSFPSNLSDINVDKELEKQMEQELTRRFQQMITKAQDERLDPFGYGAYARAYLHSEWKKVQDNWDEEFARAKVNIYTDVKIMGVGTTQ